MDNSVIAESRVGIRTDRDWPHIRRAIQVRPECHVGYQYRCWADGAEKLGPTERAAGYDEWADYFEYRLAKMSDELAGNLSQRYMLEIWTDSMSYMCRRLAAFARGEDPGEAIPQYERRPDLRRARRAHLNDSEADELVRST